MRRDVIRRSLKVSLIVGTVLVGINQGDLIISGAFSAHLYWKVPMTYLVPFMVSTYAAVSAIINDEDNRPVTGA